MSIAINDNENCEIFVNLFQNLKLFTMNINMHFNKERLYVQGMDSANISIFEISIMGNWFDAYNIEESIVIGVNSNILFKIMNTRANHQAICFHISGDNVDVELRNQENTKDEFNKYFKVPMIDMDSDTLQIPETEYDLNMTFSSKKFKSIVDQLANFGQTMDVIYMDDKIYLNSESPEDGAMKIEIGLEDIESCEVTEEMEINASYAIRYIHNMTQFMKIAKEVNVMISNDIPLQIQYVIGDEENGNYIRFFLAPKIKDD